ncbi:MAG: hypothetical protein R3E32_24300 [Chitinophagales bacterium]
MQNKTLLPSLTKKIALKCLAFLVFVSCYNSLNAATHTVCALGCDFTTIQAAIDAAAANDIIDIQDANHTEGHITVSQSVTIQGQGKNVTTVSSSYNTASSGHGNPASAWIITAPGTTVHIKDMTLDATGIDTYTALRFQDGGSVDNVAFNEIKHSSSPYLGIAIQVQDGHVDITNCTFTNIGRIGVHFRAGVIDPATISGTFTNNTYTGKGDGDWLDYALDISGDVTVTITGNTITGNTGEASSDGSTSAGILITTYFPAGENLPNDITITSNTITGNTVGVSIGFDPAADVSVATINNNDLSNNPSGGIVNVSPSATVDGSMNWWGDASGPSGEGSGTGASVSPNVTFGSWATSLAQLGLNPSMPIPTLSEWSLIILALSLMTLGVLYITDEKNKLQWNN